MVLIYVHWILDHVSTVPAIVEDRTFPKTTLTNSLKQLYLIFYRWTLSLIKITYLNLK